MKFDEVIKSAETHTWSSELEVGELLSVLIKMSAYKHVLETGVFRGRTSCFLINALPPDGSYTGIDVEDNRSTVIKDFMKDHKFILGDSREEVKKLPQRHFDLIFIDSVHELDFLRVEFKECERVIKNKGLIVLHDAYLPGVLQWLRYLQTLSWFEVVILDTCDEWKYNRGVAIVKYLHD